MNDKPKLKLSIRGKTADSSHATKEKRHIGTTLYSKDRKNISKLNEKDNSHDLIYFTASGLRYNSKGKKEFTNYCPRWKNKTIEEYLLMQKTNHNVKCILTGKMNDITVYDFDSVDVYWKTLKEHPELEEAYTVKTPKGFHIYFKYDKDILTTTNEELLIDIRNDDAIIFGAGTTIDDSDDKYVIHHNGRLDMEVPKDLALLFKSPIKKLSTRTDHKIDDFERDDVNSELLRQILENINLDAHCTGYNQWLKFIWAIRYSVRDDSEGLIIADKYSQKIKDYTNLEDIKKYYYDAKVKKIGFEYLKSLSKLSNNEKHSQIMGDSCMEYKIEEDDYYLAKIAIDLLKDIIIKNHGNFYYYTNPYWVVDDPSCQHICMLMRDKLRDFIGTQLNKVVTNMNGKTEEQIKTLFGKKKVLDQCLKKVNSNHGSKAILSDFKQYYPVQNEIKFDFKRPYYFCFKNIAYDLRSNQPVKVRRDDYITQNTGYNYRSPDTDKVELIDNLFKMILPNTDSRLCYISVLRLCMIGILLEKIIIANGSGRNGKGLINNLLKIMLGSMYCYRGNITTITEDIKSGANPEIANMHNCRCVMFSEPNDRKTLNTGTIKALTGEGDINARRLYQNNTECRLLLTMVVECNNKPRVDGRIDEALIGRFINIFFPSTFTSDPNLYEKIEGYYKANTEYKDDIWKEEYKCALFTYLLRYDYTKIYEPQSVRDATKKYLLENDDFSIFMDKYYEKNNDKDFVPIKEMMKLYRNNYLKIGTRAHKQMTKKKFEELLTENLFWKDFYKRFYLERYTKEGKQVYCVLTNIKCREDIDED